MLYSALIGNPVRQSVSPILYRLFGESTGCEYSHLKITISTADKLATTVTAFEALGFVGFNITIPYKKPVMAHLTELDPKARAIGAVNTVVLKNGKRIGYNTDCYGAVHSIATKLRPMGKKDRVVILGSGGAARALIHGAYQSTEKVTIFGREAAELKKLANELASAGHQPNCRPWEKNEMLAEIAKADFLLNATPVGMVPDINADPIEGLWTDLSKTRQLSELFVFDAIFNPYLTLMATRAKEKGAPVCSGLWMMIYQAVEAFELWTGNKVDDAICERAHDILKDRLTKKANS